MINKRSVENEKNENKILEFITKILHWFETIIALISIVFVAIGIVYLVGEIGSFWGHIGHGNLHDVFEETLSTILLLVVGVELAILLVRRTPESLVEVMFFVIARKMLIKTDTFYQLLIGVVALGGLFAIRKYLEQRKKSIKE